LLFGKFYIRLGRPTMIFVRPPCDPWSGTVGL